MRRLLVLVLPALAVAGCATAVAPPAPAVTAYAKADCRSAPDLGTAISLAPDKKRKQWAVSRMVASDTPCLRRDGVSGPYLVYALPAHGAARMIELGAVMEAGRMFSPAVTLLDAQGAATRSFAPDQYMTRTGVLSVQFAPRADERYMLVTADPARVGASYDALRTGVTSTYVSYGLYGGGTSRSGHETQVSLAYSYEGTVRATMVAPEDTD